MYVRERALDDVENLVEAVFELTLSAKEMVDRRDHIRDEERAFLELLGPMDDVLRLVREYLALVTEGEDDWRSFLESHPELAR